MSTARHSTWLRTGSRSRGAPAASFLAGGCTSGRSSKSVAAVMVPSPESPNRMESHPSSKHPSSPKDSHPLSLSKDEASLRFHCSPRRGPRDRTLRTEHQLQDPEPQDDDRERDAKRQHHAFLDEFADRIPEQIEQPR